MSKRDRSNWQRIEVTVSIWIDEDADPVDVFENMGYEYTHPKIRDTELTDFNTED